MCVCVIMCDTETGPSWAVVPQENNTFCTGKFEQVKLFLFMP